LTVPSESNPLALVCELTHRCPLHCVYCSNPQELAARASELSTTAWVSVFRQAAELGVLQADFTGGEPLARTDIVELVRAARSAGLYVSLITSGLPLDEAKLGALIAAGLDHFQLSFQGSTEPIAEEISGTKTHAQKLRALDWLKSRRVAVTLNFVLHRRNLHQMDEMLAIAESSSATRLDEFLAKVKAAEERLRGKIRVEYVVPDYYAKFPKPCMGGWGRKVMLITPRGDALPCHAAAIIPGMQFENVKEKALREIWEASDAFNKFRGESWMQEPCKSCDRRAQDFGGCRCQALLLAGDASATDPVCSLSPRRANVDAILVAANSISPPKTSLPVWKYRPNPS
jgi:PqqA peptide cyclase